MLQICCSESKIAFALYVLLSGLYLTACKEDLSLADVESDEDSVKDTETNSGEDPSSESDSEFSSQTDSDEDTSSQTDLDENPSDDSSNLTNGLKGVYFNDVTFMYGKAHERIDPNIDFDWGEGSPAPGVDTGKFCVRWTGSIRPEFSERYTFTAVADDSVRIWVNNKRIINDWSSHRAKEYTGEIALNAGELYRIKIEYFDLHEKASIQLYWSSPSQEKEIVPTSNLFTEYENLPLEPMHAVNNKIELVSAHYTSIHSSGSLHEGNFEMRLDAPEGTQPGDVMFIVLGMSGGVPKDPPAGFPDGGWTQIAGGFDRRDPADINVFGYYKVFEEGDSTVYIISKFHQKFATIFTLRGVSTTDTIVDKGGSANTGGRRNVAPSVNGVPDGALINGFMWDDKHVANPIDGMYSISAWSWGDDGLSVFIQTTNAGQTGKRTAISDVENACCGGNNAAVSFTVRPQ